MGSINLKSRGLSTFSHQNIKSSTMINIYQSLGPASLLQRGGVRKLSRRCNEGTLEIGDSFLEYGYCYWFIRSKPFEPGNILESFVE